MLVTLDPITAAKNNVNTTIVQYTSIIVILTQQGHYEQMQLQFYKKGRIRVVWD
jgi:hypothetical protein